MMFHDTDQPMGNDVLLVPTHLKNKRQVYDFGSNAEIGPWIFCQQNNLTSYPEYNADYVDAYFTGDDLPMGRGYMIQVDGMDIGFISYSRDELQGVYELDIWMASEKSCGHGYGSEALRLLSDALLRIDEVRQLIIVPDEANHQAIRSYHKAGFCELNDTLAQRLRKD